MHAITKKINNRYRNLSLVLVVFVMALTACEGDGGGNDPLTITASKTPQAGTRDIRSRYAIFTISATGGVADYKLALKAGTSSPSASDMNSKKTVLTRTLGNGNINVYIPFHIDGTLFDGGTQDLATARSTALQPSTAYTLWAMPSSGGTISQIGTVTTDPPNTLDGSNGTPDGITLTVRVGEVYFGWNISNNDTFLVWSLTEIKPDTTEIVFLQIGGGDTVYTATGADYSPAGGWFDTTAKEGFYYFTIPSNYGSTRINSTFTVTTPHVEVFSFNIQ